MLLLFIAHFCAQRAVVVAAALVVVVVNASLVFNVMDIGIVAVAVVDSSWSGPWLLCCVSVVGVVVVAAFLVSRSNCCRVLITP